MAIFMKLLGIAIGLLFIFFGVQFFFRGKRIVQAIQKQKYGRVNEPRKQEITMSKVIGIVLFLIGFYYALTALLSLL
jgi:hypothetical protein